MEIQSISSDIKSRLSSARHILVGLGEEWQIRSGQETGKQEAGQQSAGKQEQILQAYGALYQLLKDKDYFIVTMATDARIYTTRLGSTTERVTGAEPKEEPAFSCTADPQTLARMDRIFPPVQRLADVRERRIVAPCGNETWRQCSRACTKDIWEPGEIPEDICPHCGAPLTGNTMEADTYIEEGYLPQWNHFTQWLSGTWNQDLLILELGVGFQNPSVIRFPFEKTAYVNQKSHLVRVHQKLPQVTSELAGRADSIRQNSVEWILAL